MQTNKTPQCFILTDSHNLFYRQVNMTNPALGIDSMIGMALHLILNSMKKEYNKWNGTHTVMFLEGRSWRKKIYSGYKADRAVKFALQTEKEKEDHNMLVEAFNDFTSYIKEKTNVTVVHNPEAEADDMIAIWIESHPDDQHILISTDSDFFQLLKFPNLTIYDPVKDVLIRQDGVYSEDGKKLEFHLDSNARIKIGKENPNFVCDPDWFSYGLFLKCIRGDKTDNIFSAFPGVREKGSKNTIGIRDAYADMKSKGFNWNNFMLQKWVDHEEVERVVKDRYEINKKLIDLSEIPEDIKTKCLESIAEQTGRAPVSAPEVGHGFMKFCARWDLKKIGNSAEAFMPMFKSRYSK